MPNCTVMSRTHVTDLLWNGFGYLDGPRTEGKTTKSRRCFNYDNWMFNIDIISPFEIEFMKIFQIISVDCALHNNLPSKNCNKPQANGIWGFSWNLYSISFSTQLFTVVPTAVELRIKSAENGYNVFNTDEVDRSSFHTKWCNFAILHFFC